MASLHVEGCFWAAPSFMTPEQDFTNIYASPEARIDGILECCI
jgi:hypothetical protein